MSLRGTLHGSSIISSSRHKSAPNRHEQARDAATFKLLRRLSDEWEGDDDDDFVVAVEKDKDAVAVSEEILKDDTNEDVNAATEETVSDAVAKEDETIEVDSTDVDLDDKVAILGTGDMTNSTVDMDQDSIEVEVDNDSLNNNNSNDNNNDDDEEETTTPTTVVVAEHETQSSMLDLSGFTQSTTICQDDPTYVHLESGKSCAEIVVGDDGKSKKKNKKKSLEEVCESDSGLKDDDGKMIQIGQICKRSCGVCNNENEAEVVLLDEQDNNGYAKEGEEVEVIEEEIELIKETLDELKSTNGDDEKGGDDGGMVDEETKEFVEELEEELKLDEMEVEELIQNDEEDEGSGGDDAEGEDAEGEVEGDGNGDGKSSKGEDASETESTENEELVLEEADEDDAYIPEEKDAVKEDENETTDEEEEVKDDLEETTDEDLAGDQEKKEDGVDTDAVMEDDDDSTLTDKDEAKLDSDANEKEVEEKVESELESTLEDTDGEDASEVEAEEASEENVDGEEKVEDKGSDSGTKDAVEEDEEAIDTNKSPLEGNEEVEVAPENKVDSSICKDDPDFEYKGYDGFNCQYIKENKPDKCEKKHAGVKVGLISCPVSCDMVDECLALHEQEKVVASEEAADEEEAVETETEDVDESTTDQKDDLELEEEMESELETALEQGTVDVETAEKLDEEILEAIEEGVGGEFEKELEDELGLAGGDDEKEDFVEVPSNTTAVANTTDHLTTIELSLDEDASTIEIDGPLVVANLTISENDLSFCQDDPDFKFKGYDGFNCQYIKENKPEKCNKVHNGEKVGVVSCPVSCDMVDECVALQESKVDAALDSALSSEEDDNDEIDTATKQNIDDEQNEDLLEEEGSAKVFDEDDTNEVLGNEEDEATLAEESDSDENVDTQDGSAALEEEEVVEAKASNDVEDKNSDEQDEVPTDEEVDETNVTSDLCQDDPDFKFKGYDGFNCEYIKENKPEKCNKVHNGEKVGVASCPVSCGMVDECMALQTQKDSADDAEVDEENEVIDDSADESAVDKVNDSSVEASANDEAVPATEAKVDEVVEEQDEENEVAEDDNAENVSTEDVSEQIDEDKTAEDVATEDAATEDDTADDGEEDQAIDTTEVCQDDPDFKFKGYDGFNCQYIKENKPEKCNKLHSGEKVGVVSCPVSCGMVDECMARQEALATEADAEEDNDEDTGDETSSNNLDEAEVDTEAVPQEDDEENESKVEIGINDEELEEELEAKLEEALEEGELNEEEAEELEYEMEEALEEGLGEVFEAELEKELRCKDDPEFLFLDGDLERDCVWIRQNERCEHVHEDTGKVIGKFFCPETCGMEEECEKVTAADNTLPSTEAEADDRMKYGDDMFEPVPKGTKSMADELQIESEFDNSASNSFKYENEGGDFGNDEGNFNGVGENSYDEFKDTEDLNQWDNNMGELPASQEYNQEPTYGESFSQPTNGAENWEGYGGSNQQDSFENNLPPIDYDENWLEEESDFPFGFLILIFLGVGFFIFKKSQNRSRLQDHSRGGYQRVGRQLDVQDHSKRY